MNNPLLVAGAPALSSEDDMMKAGQDPSVTVTDSEDDSGSEYDSSDYDSSDDELSSDDDEEESAGGDYEDLEAALRLGQRQSDMKRALSSPAMSALFIDDATPNTAQTISGLQDLAARMKRSEPTAYMQKAVEEVKPETVEDPLAGTVPDEYLQELLEGISAKSFPSETWHDYFQTMTPEHVDAYTTEMVQAIRNDDYKCLRERLRKGYTLQCCNTHGESIVHLACRRGSHDMLRFLMEEGEVSVRIRDDKGRTPLHDACWTETPNFPLVYALLESSPELLFVQDHRGHTPLSYAPKKCWGQWNAFLQKHRIFLRASVRSLRFDRAKYYVRTIVPCLK